MTNDNEPMKNLLLSCKFKQQKDGVYKYDRTSPPTK
jgi:hypothetical protein